MPLASSRGRDGARDTTATIVAAVALASFPIIVALARHDGAPVGADTPVYVWWARLVGAAGSCGAASVAGGSGEAATGPAGCAATGMGMTFDSSAGAGTRRTPAKSA